MEQRRRILPNQNMATEKLNLLLQRCSKPYCEAIDSKLKGEEKAQALIDNAIDVIHKQEIENIRVDNANRKKHNDAENGKAKVEKEYKPNILPFREISEAVRMELDETELRYCLKNIKRKYCN